MQKFSPALDGRPPDGRRAILVLERAATTVLDQFSSIGLTPRISGTALGLLVISLLGWLDLTSKPGLHFEFLYLLATAMAGWLGGSVGGLLCSCASAFLLFLSEERTGASASGLVAFWWNTVLRFGTFGLLSWLTAEVGSLSRRQAQAIQERTSSLKSAVEERRQAEDWLQEAMHLLQGWGENVRSIFWISDPLRTEFEFVNAQFEKVWGESRETLYAVPGTWLNRVHHEDRERVAQAIIEKQSRGEFDEEYRVVGADGSTRWVHDRAFPLQDEFGAVYRTLGIAEDITEQKRTEAMLQAERDIGVALSSTNDLHSALQRLLEIAAHLEGVQCGGVYLTDSETGELQLQAHHGLSEDCVHRVSRYASGSHEARTAKAGHSVYLRHDQVPRNVRVFWGDEGMSSVALVPLQHKGSALGLLIVGSYAASEIQPRTRIGIEMIASQVSGAIARIQAENALRRSEAHLRTVINHAPIALLAMDAQGRLTLEEGLALPAMGLSPGRDLKRTVASLFARFPFDLEGVHEVDAGEPLSSLWEVGDTVLDCRLNPIRDVQGRPAGSVLVAADVTERLQLQREILEISDRERARIGQDLHDGLCQQLIGTAFKAQGLERALKERSGPDAETATRICGLLDEAIVESRRLCRGLYPLRLSTEGLLPALNELARGASEKFQVACRCESTAQSLEFPLGTATHIYRIAQEAVNNALKHGQARNVTIELRDAPNGLELRVTDDGSGFTYPPPGGGGMGLHIMQYRAGLIGARLEVRTGSGGTQISCVVPQAQPNEGNNSNE